MPRPSGERPREGGEEEARQGQFVWGVQVRAQRGQVRLPGELPPPSAGMRPHRVSCLSPRPVSLPLEEAARETFSGEEASQHSSVSVTSGRGERHPSCTARAGRGMDGCLREKRLPKQTELDSYSSLKITKESYLSSWEIASCSKLGHYVL